MTMTSWPVAKVCQDGLLSLETSTDQMVRQAVIAVFSGFTHVPWFIMCEHDLLRTALNALRNPFVQTRQRSVSKQYGEKGKSCFEMIKSVNHQTVYFGVTGTHYRRQWAVNKKKPLTWPHYCHPDCKFPGRDIWAETNEWDEWNAASFPDDFDFLMF